MWTYSAHLYAQYGSLKSVLKRKSKEILPLVEESTITDLTVTKANTFIRRDTNEDNTNTR